MNVAAAATHTHTHERNKRPENLENRPAGHSEEISHRRCRVTNKSVDGGAAKCERDAGSWPCFALFVFPLAGTQANDDRGVGPDVIMPAGPHAEDRGALNLARRPPRGQSGTRQKHNLSAGPGEAQSSGCACAVPDLTCCSPHTSRRGICKLHCSAVPGFRPLILQRSRCLLPPPQSRALQSHDGPAHHKTKLLIVYLAVDWMADRPDERATA